MNSLDFLLQDFSDEFVLFHCRQAFEGVAGYLDCEK